MQRENERFGWSSSALNLQGNPLGSAQEWGCHLYCRTQTYPSRSSPRPSKSQLPDRARALVSQLGSITARQDLYTVDGIKTSLRTPKFINNYREKKLGVWWRQDTCIFLQACQSQWESFKDGSGGASCRNTLCSGAAARGPGMLCPSLMKWSVTPDSNKSHVWALTTLA
jgi:hypothetical protein